MKTRLLIAASSVALLGAAAPGMAASILIDNFDDAQAVYDEPNPSPQWSQEGADGNGNIIGGYRDLYVETDLTGVDNATELRTIEDLEGRTLLAFNNDATASATGRGWVTYDGSNAVANNPASLDTDGLGGIDLLIGPESATGFFFDVVFADADLYIEIRAWDTDGDNDGSNPDAVYAETLPLGGGNPFVSFANPLWDFDGDGIDWNRVGALQFFVQSGENSDVPALDGAIDRISVQVIPLPASALLLLGGMGGLGALRLRRRAAA